MKNHSALFLFVFILIYSGFSLKDNWTALFNGRTLQGWTVKSKAEDRNKNYWTVKDGYIEVNSLGDKNHDYVWLMTDKEYSDFSIKLKSVTLSPAPIVKVG